jgi:hypothetical protein
MQERVFGKIETVGKCVETFGNSQAIKVEEPLGQPRRVMKLVTPVFLANDKTLIIADFIDDSIGIKSLIGTS